MNLRTEQRWICPSSPLARSPPPLPFRKNALSNISLATILEFFFSYFRLPAVQQPRERHHRAQVRLLRRGGDGLLHLLPQDALLQTEQAHHTLLLQRGEQTDRLRPRQLLMLTLRLWCYTTARTFPCPPARSLYRVALYKLCVQLNAQHYYIYVYTYAAR